MQHTPEEGNKVEAEGTRPAEILPSWPLLRTVRWTCAHCGEPLLSAAVVGVALAFLAADSATHIQDNRACDLLAPLYPLVPHQHVRYSPDAVHFGYLYVLWGAPLGVLLLTAVRALRRARRFSSSTARDAYYAA